MKSYVQILAGLILIAVAIAPGLTGAAPAQRVTDTPDNCLSSPLPRPVPETVDNPVVTGTVEQAKSNESIIQVTYQVIQGSSDQTLYVAIPKGGQLLSQVGAIQIDENRVRANLSGRSFSIRYAIGQPAIGPLTYTNGQDWIIAPTPEHSGVSVALVPARDGFIGQNILYLGNYSLHERQVGCQTIQIIKPEISRINADRRLKLLDSVARRFDLGKPYKTVRIFPSPKKLGKDGEEGGFVWETENEVVVYDQASIHSPENIWVHEYIHTRQYETDGEHLEWFVEASATYYAARLSLELGLISNSEYNRELAGFARYDPNETLAEAKQEPVAYRWGAVVLAHIDALLVQNGQVTLLDIYHEMNQDAQYRGRPSLEKFEGLLESRGGLNSNQLNETRKVILGSKRPQPRVAYEGGWLAAPWAISRSLPIFTLMILLRTVSGLIGIILIVWSVKPVVEKRLNDTGNL